MVTIEVDFKITTLTTNQVEVGAFMFYRNTISHGETVYKWDRVKKIFDRNDFLGIIFECQVFGYCEPLFL